MKPLLASLGVATILLVFWDAFETLVLPRRVSRRFRLARVFFRSTWWVWTRTAGTFRRSERRENYLSFYGPLSLLFLLAVWAVGLVIGFAILQKAGGHFRPHGSNSLATITYLSASTFFTLGLGDVVPASHFSRFFMVFEAGSGFGFLALVIAYLPVMYQAFSRREARISMLDERAGSPPSAGELFRRRGGAFPEMGTQFLRDWELWSAELLESHLSYPVLGYFRSQHDNQSWLAALTLILDACALVMTGIDGFSDSQARMTFAMARHAAVDLTTTFGTPPSPPHAERLPAGDFERLRALLGSQDVTISADQSEGEAEATLAELRSSYEPYVHALSHHLKMALPPWLPTDDAVDNWEKTAWEAGTRRRRARARAARPGGEPGHDSTRQVTN